MTDLNRRSLGLSAVGSLAALSLLGGCATAKTLTADAQTAFDDAVAAGKTLATFVSNEAGTVISAIPGLLTTGNAVKAFQGALGLAEQALGAVASASPAYLAITTAITAASTVAQDVASMISQGAEVGSSSVQAGLASLVTATTNLQVTLQAPASFTATANAA